MAKLKVRLTNRVEMDVRNGLVYRQKSSFKDKKPNLLRLLLPRLKV